MTPGHPYRRGTSQFIDSKAKGLTMLLRELHAVNRESRIALTVVGATVELAADVKGLIAEMARLRVCAGAADMKPGQRACLEDGTRYIDVVLRNMAEKNKQLLDRMNAQINLVRLLFPLTVLSAFSWSIDTVYRGHWNSNNGAVTNNLCRCTVSLRKKAMNKITRSLVSPPTTAVR